MKTPLLLAVVVIAGCRTAQPLCSHCRNAIRSVDSMASLYNVTPPIRVLYGAHLDDGGSVGAAIIDAKGKVVEFGIDGRFRHARDEYGDPIPAKLYANLYVGFIRPVMTRRLPYEGKEEEHFLSILKEHLRASTPPDPEKNENAHFGRCAIEIMLRRRAGLPDHGEEEASQVDYSKDPFAEP